LGGGLTETVDTTMPGLKEAMAVIDKIAGGAKWRERITIGFESFCSSPG
jgi:hypothetical protein